MIYYCENPLGTIKHVLFQNQIASKHNLQRMKVKSKFHPSSIALYMTNLQTCYSIRIIFKNSKLQFIMLAVIRFHISVYNKLQVPHDLRSTYSTQFNSPLCTNSTFQISVTEGGYSKYQFTIFDI